MPDYLFAFPPMTLLALCATLFIAALVRGFAGFGAGMIFMPIAAALIAPSVAAASFLILDGILALPFIIKAIKQCDWRTVLPAVCSAVIFVQAGTWLLATMDVLVLRWVLFSIITALLALLISGWTYSGRAGTGISLGVGAVAGFLGGISQTSGPPVIAFWLSSAKEPAIVRANLIMFFALSSIGTFAAYILHGFFTANVFALLIYAVPLYAIGLFLGSRLFGKAQPIYYRYTAYALIALAAITSMPALDGILR